MVCRSMKDQSVRIFSAVDGSRPEPRPQRDTRMRSRIGRRGNPHWISMTTIEELLHRRNDLSTFVVHFTRDSPSSTAYDNLLSILRVRSLEARSIYGMAKDLVSRFPDLAATQRAVCFTETPLEHAWMMCSDIEHRSMQFNGYGIAFTKTFARRNGTNPVWYLDITPGHDWLTVPITKLVQEAEAAAIRAVGLAGDPSSLATAPILRLTPFIEQMGPTSTGRKEFWWEREWRHIGDLNFRPKDIVVVFAPENTHDALSTALSSEGYKMRMLNLIDASWGLERMIGTLAGIDELGPFPV